MRDNNSFNRSIRFGPLRRRAETPRRGLPSLRADGGGVDEKDLDWVIRDGMRKVGGMEVLRLSAGPKAAVRRCEDVVCILCGG